MRATIIEGSYAFWQYKLTLIFDFKFLMSNHIKVYARVRPRRTKFSSIERSRASATVPDRHTIESPVAITFKAARDSSQTFNFEHVFDTGTCQQEVFDIVAKPIVDSALAGYHSTLFCYGQTGSGKTFTITGGAERYQDRGIIPRTIQHIFAHKQSTNSTYTVAISYLEIYNEIGYDLLHSDRDSSKLTNLPRVAVMEDENECVHFTNLSVTHVATEEDALNLLFVGDTNRMIAETPSNPSSSRSHCIFRIMLTSKTPGRDTVAKSTLNLVDLAGSERVGRTGIDGTLLKEAKYINLSLHYLEQVIVALRETTISKSKRSHVPYRNSMMTMVLRDSLGGNCKTSMIATLAIEDVLIDESISTCRFAQRVALVSNKARLNEEVEPGIVIERLKREIENLKAHLENNDINQGTSSGLIVADYEIEKYFLANTESNKPLMFILEIRILTRF